MEHTTSNMMLSAFGASPLSLRKFVGRRARDARLASRRSQAHVALAAGISLPTLQRFEAGAKVNLDVLVRVAIALNAERGLYELFAPPDVRTIDEVLRRRALPQRGLS
ncbi:MAG TPA: helix-turn-helix transcriptional regulator [Candidatus Baltobacteraceae bacterium]|jgi:transcriptional regulator with XRE-family HTH domain|nr:helix-turn-helix transcriptional regulator [Candidatus Baltobacteraceae bacterium]